MIAVHDLQRDGALELLVPAAPHLSHPSGAEERIDADPADAHAGGDGHGAELYGSVQVQ
jgi:hypothetical protein